MSWRKEVLKQEGLNDWTIKNDSDGLCIKSRKMIWCKPNDQALFLHEVAHAITPSKYDKWDKTGHHSIWGDNYTELIRKYMIIN